MKKHFHKLAMNLIFIGGLILLGFSIFWFIKSNVTMAAGMLIMSIVALSNLYLHTTAMRKK